MSIQNSLFYKEIPNKTIRGIPYMGSKSKLATKILNAIYSAVGDFDRFYDLFGGGATMSIAALEAGHTVYYNELNSGVANLLQHITNGGKIPNDWVSREHFNNHKNDNDWYGGYIKTVWSFGNNQKDYLFSKEKEVLKKEAHEYLLKNGYLDNRNLRVVLIKEFKQKMKLEGRFDLQQLEQLERLQQLERLERLQQLEQLERLEQIGRYNNLVITNLSYSEVSILPNSIIYCDPPYQNTAKYQKTIDHNKFYAWCLSQNNPIFISEYNVPSDFIKIASFDHRSILSATANNKVTEKLYWNGKKLN